MKITIKKLRNGGGGLFVFGILLWIGFPMALKYQIKKAFGLKPGTEIRGIWKELPFPLDFKIYIFNVTNSDEVQEGKKPILNEVGPFFYDEYKIKENLIDREDDDTVEYSMKTVWVFNPKKSKYTGEEELVVPHLMILGMVLTTLKEKPAAVGILAKAVDSIFHKPDSIFVRAKAKDILFDGLPIDCSVTDFAGTAVCNLLKKEATDLIPDGENHYKFSFLGGKNNTILPQRMRVLRGIKNFKDVGRVVEFDGKKSLNVWPDDRCNAFNGTDGTIFPPLFGPDDELVAFTFEACRNLNCRFARHTKHNGIKTLRYMASLGDQSKDKSEKCYCPTPDTCLTKNLFDLSKCLGVPVIISLPHFYDSEEKYQHMVEGLNPNQDEHEGYLDIEPMTAMPFIAYKKLQFNLFIKPVPKFKLMKNFPEALLPLLWVEEGIILPDEFITKVKVVFMTIMIVNFMKWLMILGGIGLGVASGVLYYKKQGTTDEVDTAKVIPVSSQDDMKVYTVMKDKSWQHNMNISTQAAMVPANLDKN